MSRASFSEWNLQVELLSGNMILYLSPSLESLNLIFLLLSSLESEKAFRCQNLPAQERTGRIESKQLEVNSQKQRRQFFHMMWFYFQIIQDDIKLSIWWTVFTRRCLDAACGTVSHARNKKPSHPPMAEMRWRRRWRIVCETMLRQFWIMRPATCESSESFKIITMEKSSSGGR